jgi:hypothetical protein
MDFIRCLIFVFKTLFLLGTLTACSMSTKPLRQIPAADFSADRDAFFKSLNKIAGPNAINCGIGKSSIPCIRKAWEDHRPFTVATDEFMDYCPNLNGYASDTDGNVYRVSSCPNRDHKKGEVLVPRVEPCESYSPPVNQFGDGQCSVLDNI